MNVLLAGKTTTCELVAEATGFRNINVGEWVSSQSLHSGWDSKFEAHIIDEDKVCCLWVYFQHSAVAVPAAI